MGPAYVAQWMHEFTHWESTDSQKQATEHLGECLGRLLEKRNDVQLARGAFAPVSVFYPNSRPTQLQQNRLHTATTDFFQTYYAAISSFVSFIKRHSDVFGEAPHNSNARFISWYKTHALFPEDVIPLMESARSFRALLDHTASHQPYNWHTVELAPGFTSIVLIGPAARASQIPTGAEPLDDERWQFVAPDEDLVCWALAVQLNATILVISGHRDHSRGYECSWSPTPSDDDVTMSYPVFAPADGRVSAIIRRTTTVHTTTVFEGDDPRDSGRMGPG